MKIVKFHEIFYSKKIGNYVQENSQSTYDEGDKLRIISGTQARAMFLRGERPPTWFMRPEISNMVLEAINNGEQVFEEEEV